MLIKDIVSFKGRNIYSHQKVIKIIVDLEEYNDIPTNKISGFNDYLLKCLPGITEHSCSLGVPGGFKIRLDEGTYLAHVLEHSALELQNMVGHSVGFGRARQIGDSSSYTVVYAYKEEIIGIEAGKLAVKMINSFLYNLDFDFNLEFDNLIKLKWKYCLGPSTQAIADAASERGIPVTRIGNSSILQLGYGKYHKKIECTLTENTSCISVDTACDKALTKDLLSQSGIPVPKGFVCHCMEDALNAADKIGYPVVVKPVYSNQGKGVSIKLQSADEVADAFNIARKIDDNVMVEEYVEGKDYRILVIGNQMAAASLRIPAHIVGNGKNTIKELVDLKNMNDARGDDHEKPLTKIKIDDICINYLKKQGLSIDSIPEKDTTVYLKCNGNISSGGEAVDCTEKVHPYNQEIARRAARIIGLDIAGIDITCKDISIPLTPENGAVIEVNAAPGIRMHLYPSKGKPRKIGNAIVNMLFPSGSKHSIPIVSVTGTNGKTTTTRMVAHILRTQGLQVGMTTTSGIYINDKCIMEGDCSGPLSARILLNDKAVEAAVLETARGGIIRSGLGYDLSDVGILLNISDDHIGLDGVNSLDDLLNVKSLVIEAVKSNGYAILNADDPMVVKAADRVKSNVVYFSRFEDNIIVHKHISEGGIAVYIKDSFINIATGNGLIQSLSISQIPSTFGGRLAHNIENCLAAVSTGYVMHVPLNMIENAMTTFLNDEIYNPGRFNIYNIKDYRLVVDYGHNSAGYRRIIESVRKFGASRLIGVIGVPGDRSDEAIIEIGRISGEAFSKIYIKEDSDLRGRSEGETYALLKKGALSAGMAKSDIEYIRNEANALKKAMDNAKSGDLIVVFYEKLNDIVKVINNEIESLQQTNSKPADKMILLEAK